MTREEAIRCLSVHSSTNGPGLRTDKQHYEAKQIAIKALEQEPCEDAITRILKRMWNCRGNHTTSIDKVKMEQIIRDELPSVKPQEPSDIANDGTLIVNVDDGRKISRVLVCGANHWGGLYYPDEQEPKTGHWIAQDIHNCHTDFKCSECDYIHSFMHLYGKPTADYTYCPNCGCRMVEPQESEVEQ